MSALPPHSTGRACSQNQQPASLRVSKSRERGGHDVAPGYDGASPCWLLPPRQSFTPKARLAGAHRPQWTGGRNAQVGLYVYTRTGREQRRPFGGVGVRAMQRRERVLVGQLCLCRSGST
jgi:hypothetical protein